MPHIAPQKIVNWPQNSGGENVPLLLTRSKDLLEKSHFIKIFAN
jgi:hypothetical protein